MVRKLYKKVAKEIMENLKIPKNYKSALDLHDTQVGIKTVKDFFQGMLSNKLNLQRVTAPLFVTPDSRSTVST